MLRFLGEGVEPPKRTRIASAEDLAVWEASKKLLRASPGQWAIVEEGVGKGRVSYWKRGLGLTFEVTSRNAGRDRSGKERVDVYARRSPLTVDSRK